MTTMGEDVVAVTEANPETLLTVGVALGVKLNPKHN